MAIKPEDCKGMRTFNGMEYEQVEKFVSFGEEQIFKADKVIFSQEDKNDGNFYLIVSGSVNVVKKTRKGEEVSATLEKGNAFGEMGVFEDKPRAAMMKTATETRCLVLTKAKYQQLREADPKLALIFAENLLLLYFDRFRAVAAKAETSSFWL